MDNVTILPPLPGGKRAKITEPVFDHEAVDRVLRRMDSLISLLRQVVSAMEMKFQTATAVDQDLVSAIEDLQRWQRECYDQLCTLL